MIFFFRVERIHRCVPTTALVQYLSLIALLKQKKSKPTDCTTQDLDVERDGHGRLVRGGGGGGQSRRDSSRDRFRPPPAPGRDYRDDGGRGGSGGRGGVSSGPGLGTLASRSSTRWHDTYGLSPQFLESLGITGPLCHRVFVANVSFTFVFSIICVLPFHPHLNGAGEFRDCRV